MERQIVLGRYRKTNQKAIIVNDVELTIEDPGYCTCIHELIVRPGIEIHQLLRFAVETGADTGLFEIWNIRPWVLREYAKIDKAIQARQAVENKPKGKHYSNYPWNYIR